MRVLFVSNYFPPGYVGGAEVSAYDTCQGLLRRGAEVSVLSVNARMPERRNLRRVAEGIPVHEVAYRPCLVKNALLQVLDARVYRAVLAEIETVRPSLVHVHNVSGASLAPFVACRRSGMPVVLTLHDHWLLCPNNMLYRSDGSLCDPAVHATSCDQCFRRQDFWGNIPRRRQVFARLVRDVRFLISPSQKLISLHVAAGYNPARFRLVPYGLEPAPIPAPSESRTRAYVEQRGLFSTMLFAGAVVESKGIKTVLEALPLLSRYIANFRLLVAGGGDRRFLAALRLADPSVVILLGRLPLQEMRSVFASADLTVVPSVWYENSPVVIHESLMAGTPVLGSDVGGIPELIQPGVTGYVFSPGDASALAERAIEHFARSAFERRAMRQRCRDYARTRMNMDHHLQRLQQVYEEALRPRVHADEIQL